MTVKFIGIDLNAKNIAVNTQSNFVLNKVLIYSLSIMNGDDYSAIIAFAEPVAVDSSDVLIPRDGSLFGEV